jgi:hypothetical protein
MGAWEHGTFAQRGSIVIGVEFAILGIIGLLLNPDFGVGGDVSAEQFIVDWNGWHAVATLALAAGSLVAASRPLWAVVFQVYNAVVLTATAVWAIFDSTPAGLLAFPNAATDVVLHLVTAAMAATVVLVALRRQPGSGRLSWRAASSPRL